MSGDTSKQAGKPAVDTTELMGLIVKARKRIEELEAERRGEAVAIVGIGCRFPGADGPEQLWQNLLQGRDAVGPLSDGRWDRDALVANGPRPEVGKMQTGDGGFLDRLAEFDPGFFGIAAREAKHMDPQQRQLLQTAWHALEHAGIVPAQLEGSDTGVFVGISGNDYGRLQVGRESAQQAWAGSGNALSIAANRLSYLLNFKGPSLAIDTACSSSLVALHHAVRSLRAGESSLALVAGVNLILSPDISIALSQAGMISPSGRCHTFDASADGYVRSEGVAVLVLKRLADARRDGDDVLALVAGSAINQDGQGNGLTAPNGLAQQAVVRAALKDAGAKVADLAYVEAHGTGTPLGDPIELNNLAKVIGKREDDGCVLVGSLKSSIGHTEAAAGIAGVIKTVLCMQAGQIPGQLLLDEINPHIKLDKSALRVCRQTSDWPADRDLAGVSSFGFGGANAHVVLARYRAEPRAETPLVERSVLQLSARSEASLQRLAARLARALEPGAPLAQVAVTDLAASLAGRRTPMPYRFAAPVDSADPAALATALQRFVDGGSGAYRAHKRLGERAPRIALAFSGQGSFYPGMGSELYAQFTVFRETLERCAVILEPHLNKPLLELLFNSEAEELKQTAYAQPAIFSLQVALVQQLASWGLQADVVMGHSLGEYAAAHAAGAATLDELLPLVARRGTEMQALPEAGGMLGVQATPALVEEQLRELPALSLAAINGPESCVVAGPDAALETLREALRARGVATRALEVSHAFHSALLEPMLAPLGEAAAEVDWQPLQRPLVSNLSGQSMAAGERFDARHWVRHSREPVQFYRSLQALAEDPTTLVLEIGPKATLTELGRRSGELDVERFVPTLSGRGSEVENLLLAVASLAAHGVELEPAFLGQGSLPGRVLPRYPFERGQYWFETSEATVDSATADSAAVDSAAVDSAAVETATDPSLILDSTPLLAQLEQLSAGRDLSPGADPERTDLYALFHAQLEMVESTISSQLAAMRGRDASPALPAPANDAGPALLPLPGPEPVALRAADAPTPALAEQPLRPAAQLLWLLAQKSDNASRAYHLPALVRLRGELDQAQLQAAVDVLLARHEALRTVFPAVGEMQVLPSVSAPVVAIDARDWDRARQAAWAAELGEQLFDLAAGPLIRFRLLRCDDAEYLLSIEAHHLVFDGLSMNCLVGELGVVYGALLRGESPELPPAMPYREYLAWHHDLRDSEAIAAARDYWLGKLGGGVEVLDLPSDRPRGGLKAYRSAMQFELIDQDTCDALHRAARELGLTPFMLLFALFGAALSRFSGQRQVAIAIPTAGRPPGEQPLLGYCSDILFALCAVDAENSVEQHGQRVRADLLADFANRDYSFAWLVEDLKSRGGAVDDLPLQVVFNYQNAFIQPQFDGCESELEARELHYLDAEITLNAVDVQGHLALEFNYDPDLYDAGTAAAYLGGFAQMLRAVAAGQRGALAELPLVDEAALARLRALGAGQSLALDRRPLHRQFESRAERFPDAVALIDGETELSYAEVNARANNLARRLRDAGVGREQLVGIHLPRCADVVVAQLAASKAGAAFVYLDPAQPQERRLQIAADAALCALVGEPLAGVDLARLDPAPVAGVDEADLSLEVDPAQLMYLIYTSGSTGVPKGVMVEHHTVANYIGWLSTQVAVGAEDRMLQFSALSFDTSIEEIYTALSRGASLVLRDEELPASAAQFWRQVERQQLTLLDLPTAFWHTLVGEEAALAQVPARLRHIILGGEAAKVHAVQTWRAQAPAHIALWNTYGPTETTIVCTASRLDQVELVEGRPVPIGRPVGNAQAWVLDESRQPLPAGAVGTLYIAGTLARGYKGREAQTREVFVANPFAEGLLYKTGDRVRWRADGELEYLGRADAQLKVRGFRIEPGEVEKNLDALDQVAQSFVLAVEVNGAQRLAAYVVPAEGAEPSPAALKRALGSKLSDYMVPSLYSIVESLPVNANGKVDKRALPPIDASAQTDDESLRPLGSETEREVARLWAAVLGLDVGSIGADSNFFDLGGDSLLAMQVLTRVKAELGVELSLRDLYHGNSVAEMAALVQRAPRAGVAAPIERLSREAPLPLSSTQQRLWFLQQLDPHNPMYNLPSRLDFDGELQVEHMQAALQALVARHESLRTRVVERDGAAMVRILDDGELSLQQIDLCDAADADAELLARAREFASATFDMHGPLVRAALFRLGPTRHSLMLCAHHIITDGWSMGVLARDFVLAYNALRRGEPLPWQPLALQYVDYMAHQQALSAQVDEPRCLDYWREQLADLPELLELPTDHERPERPDGRGRVHYFSIDATLQRRVREVAAEAGVTPYAVVLSAWGVLLARLSGQSAFALGTAVANRPLAGAEDVVGFFADTLPLRVDAAGAPDFLALCRRQQEQLLDGLAHAELAFEQLVKELVHERNEAYSPIFQCMFVWQNTPAGSLAIDGLQIASKRLDRGSTQFDLVLDMAETEDGIDAMLEYRTQLFEADSAARLARWFEALLTGLLQAPARSVAAVDFRDPLADAQPGAGRALALDDLRLDAILDHYARTTPAAPAVIFQGEDGQSQTLSYREYQARAEQLACWLQSQGVDHGDRVAICSQRRTELMVAIYASMLAGAVYVPLDPDSPAERLQSLVQASGASVLLAETAHRATFADAAVPVLCLDEAMPEGQDTAALRRSTDASLPIYIIYTSGTTGAPKGVVVPHRGVANTMRGLIDTLSLDASASMLQFAPFNFDASALQIFTPLLAGGTVLLHHNPKELSAADFMPLVERYQLTMLDLPAALWRQWVDTMAEQGALISPCLKVFFTGGEALSLRAMRKWARLCEHKVMFLSSYGPTEASVTATSFVSDSEAMRDIDESALHLGEPLPNVDIHLLDVFGQPSAPGVIGEIAIAGPGLADGYLDMPEKTAESFVEHAGLGRRLYLTGDYGRYTADGRLEFHGRRDAQIKIRGFRVEPGEIEAAMLAHADIAQAVVATQASEDKRLHLVAYAVLHGDVAGDAESYDQASLRAHLQSVLPVHMVPSAVQLLPRFPLLPSGKVNKKVLPAIDLAAGQARQYVAPEGANEVALAQIWEELLKVERVGRIDNFFELGGDSILVLQMVARAKQQGLLLEVRDVFHRQDLAGLAALAVAGDTALAEQGNVVGSAPASAQQQRWLEQPPARARVLRIDFNEALEGERVAAALQALWLHHDGLRTRFEQDEAGWQQCLDEEPGSVAWRACSEAALADETDATSAAILSRRAPLFQALLVERRALVLLAHPALLDRHSAGVLLEDLHRALRAEGEGLARPKTTSVLQFAAWQAERPAASRERQREALAGVDAPVAEIVDAARAGTLGVALPEGLVEQLHSGARDSYRVRADELLLAALVAALGQAEPAAAVSVSVDQRGRDFAAPALDLSRTVMAARWSLPLHFAAAELGHELLVAVKEQWRAAPVAEGALEPAAIGRGGVLLQPREADPNDMQPWSVQLEGDEFGALADGFSLVCSHDLAADRPCVRLHYAGEVYPRDAVEALADRLVAALQRLLVLCREAGPVYTPSDFPLAAVSGAELDALRARHGDFDGLYKASFGQVGMLFHSLYSPENGAYILQTQVSLRAELEPETLRLSFGDLIARHPILRSSFVWEDRAEPLQIVHPAVETPWRVLDTSAEADEPAAFEALLQRDRAAPLDFERAPLMRLTLVKRREGYTLLWLMHHAITDGWSTPILYDDLLEFYNARVDAREAQLPQAISYERYIAWLQAQDKREALAHWRGEIGDFDSPTELNIGRGQAAESEDFGLLRTTLEPAELERLETRARAERLTLGSLMQGVWALLLSRYSGASDVLMGVTVSGRPPQLDGAESIVGMFLNALPLRAQVGEEEPLWDWLRALQTRQADNDRHNTLSFLDVQKLSRIAQGQRLAETMLIFQNTPLGDAVGAAAGGRDFAPHQHLQRLVLEMQGYQKNNYPITVFAEVVGSGLQVDLLYDRGRFDAEEMSAMAAHLRALLVGLETAETTGQLRLLDPAAERELLARSLGPHTPAPPEGTLVQLFEEQVRATPSAPALLQGEQSIDYAELDRRANRVAQALRARGVEPGQVVALCAERSIDTTAALLGILKAGAAFLALDPKYPQARLQYMLDDSGAQLLLLQPGMLAGLRCAGDSLDLAAFAAADDGAPVAAPALALDADALAYLIYTSGSTGQPKGVRALHRGAVNRLQWMWDRFAFVDGERMVQKTALSFVDCIWEIFGPLLRGVPSLVLAEEQVRDVGAFVDELERGEVSRLVLVPTLLRAMLELHPQLGDKLPALRQYICSGEALSADLVAQLRAAAPRAQLLNLYGSSEVAGDVTWYDTAELPPGRALAPLGHVLDNCSVYLLDAQLRPVPDGLPGELYIGGANLADGYHGQPQLTAEAFVDNPFGDGKLFRSRDWGRRLACGAIEFLGRQDGQVKVRGMRVELAEVEQQLRALDGVDQAVVLNRPRANGDARLVSYSTGASDVETLHAALEASLPAHMVPSALVLLDEMPLLPNGKVDRRSLPEPGESAFAAQGVDYVAPQGEVERALAGVWAEVLGREVDGVGREHNYFQLGGDSISSLQVVTRARALGLTLEVRDIFVTANLAELAAVAGRGGALDRGPLAGAVAVGRGWLGVEPAHFQRLYLPLTAGFDAAAVEAALRDLMLHHDVLRAVLQTRGEGAELVVSSTLDRAPSAPPPGGVFAARLVQSAGEAGVDFVAHPLLLDALAWRTLAEDFLALLQGRALAARSWTLQTLRPAAPPTPLVAPRRGIEHRVFAPWVAALQNTDARRLYASIEELAAAALVHSQAHFGADGPAALSLATRPAQAPRLLTQHTRLHALPASAGELLADLRAAKEHARGEPSTAAAGLSLHVSGGGALANADLRHRAAARLPAADGLRLEVDLFGEQLALRLSGAEAAQREAMERALLQFAYALHQLGELAERDAAQAAVPADFPMAPLDAPQLQSLLGAHGRVDHIYPVTPGQTGMVFQAMLEPDSTVYTLHSSVRLAAGLDQGALERAFARLLQRHGMLRTALDWDGRESALQVVEAEVQMPLEVLHWQALDEAQFERELAQLVDEDRRRGIDLRVAPLMRATLVWKHDGTAALLWMVHHAITDGWSLPLMYADLMALYNGELGLPGEPLAPSPDYADYVAWLQAQDLEAARAHWREQLDGAVRSDLVVGDGQEAESGQMGSHTVQLPAALAARLQASARREQVTLNTVVQGAWAAMLARYNQQPEQLFGVTVSGRPAALAGVDQMVGLFVNVLPLRVATDDDSGLWDWLREIQRAHNQNDGYNTLSFAEIQQLSGLGIGERLCESMIVFQNYPVDGALIEALGQGDTTPGAAAPMQQLLQGLDGHQTTSYPITLFVVPGEGQLQIEFQFDRGRFDDATIDAMAAHLLQVFRSFEEAQRLGEVEILSEAQALALQRAGRGAEQALDESSSLLALFEARCDQRPDALAVFDEQRRLSYAELDGQANALAARLASLGVGRGDVVAVHMQRSLETVATLLAVMKVGGAWLALDPNYPAERLAYMLADSGAALVLHDGEAPALDFDGGLLDATAFLAEAPREADRRAHGLGLDDLAYLIYTSGSTGKPKGVQALHRGAVNRLQWMWREMPFADDDVMVQKTALSFVDSVWEIFGPLLAGVPSLVCTTEQVQNTPDFIDTLARHRVSRLLLVPSLLRLMLELPGELADKLPALSHCFVSGEALTAELVLLFRRAMPACRLVNLYGSSEVAGDITVCDTAALELNDARASVPLGRVIDNSAVYVLDRRLRPVPRGFPGELYFDGANLARGYHGRAELSAEAFLPNPFGDGALFRSRDWGRLDARGEVEFLGRQDGQIKIRGMRVELGEIETTLRHHSGVQDAVVLPKPAPGGSVQLCAYWAGAAEEAELRGALRAVLAEHMVPTQWLQLEALPQLPNGKIDRRALAELAPLSSQRVQASAVGVIEEQLLALWSALFALPEESIDVEQSFFSLGGHSLLAARAIAEIGERTGVVIGIRQFFDNSSVRGVAATIEAELLASVSPAVLQQLISDASAQLGSRQASSS